MSSDIRKARQEVIDDARRSRCACSWSRDVLPVALDRLTEIEGLLSTERARAEAAEAKADRLAKLLGEARDEICEAWSNCSSPYMREKHEDPTLLASIDAELSKEGA